MSAEFNFSVLSSELVRAVRGKRSQARVNLKLGHSFNRMYRWESGQQSISWMDFVQLCEVCKIDLAGILRKHFGFSAPLKNYGALVKILMGEQSGQQMASSLGVSSYVVRSWRSERTVPSLEKILLLIHVSMMIIPEFCAEFSVAEPLPSLRAIVKQRQEVKKLLYQYPWIEPAIVSLSLDVYLRQKGHPPGFLQERVGITHAQEEMMFAELLRLGVVEKKQGKYSVLLPHIDTRGNLQGSSQIRSYWLEKTKKFVDALTALPKHTTIGYFVMPVSLEAQEKIRMAYYEFCNSVIAIVKADTKPKEKVEILCCQLLDLSELSEQDR
jgi:transcriptional regulator with XRE-family HTH domain